MLVLCALATAGFSGSRAVAGDVEVTSLSPTEIEISADDAEVTQVIAAIGDLIGFAVTGAAGDECGRFSGRLVGSVDDVVSRLAPACSYTVQASVNAEGTATISGIHIIGGGSQPSAVMPAPPYVLSEPAEPVTHSAMAMPVPAPVPAQW